MRVQYVKDGHTAIMEIVAMWQNKAKDLVWVSINQDGTFVAHNTKEGNHDTEVRNIFKKARELGFTVLSEDWKVLAGDTKEAEPSAWGDSEEE